MRSTLMFARASVKRGIVFELSSSGGVRSAVLRGFEGLIPGKQDLIVPGEIIANGEKYPVVSLSDGAFEKSEIRKIMFDRKIRVGRFGKNCFAGSSASAIEIPNSVGEIDPTAFVGCKQLSKLMVKSTNPNFVFENGMLMTKDRRELRFVAAGTTEVKVPAEVEVICGYAFTALTKVVLSVPENTRLREFRANAFSGVEIENLVIPPSLRVIDANAFENMQGPAQISMFEDYDNPNFVEYLGLLMDRNRTELVLGTTELHEASIPESVVRITNHAFAGCKRLSTLYFPRSSRCTEIGEYAFYGTNLETVAFPGSLEIVKSFAFANCVEMTTFEFPRESHFKLFEDSVFVGSSITAFAIPASVTSISKFAFNEMEWVTDIALSKANTALVEDIGVLFSTDRRTLYLANKEFEKAVIPKEVQVLGAWSFGKCQYLTDLRLDPAGSSLIEIGAFAIAFTYVKQFTVPSTVTVIGDSAFLHTALEKLTFQERGTLKSLGKLCFSRTKLTSVVLPASLETIEEGVFSICKYLKTVEFEPNSSLQRIGDSAFKGSMLGTIDLPPSVVSIGSSIFEGCPLTSANFSNVSVIPSLAFFGCRLTEVRISPSVTCIQSYAFSECNLLKSLIFEDDSKLIEIWPFAFHGTELETVALPESVALISNHAFSHCSKLTTLSLTSRNVTVAVDIFTDSPNARIRKTASCSLHCAADLPVSEL